MQSLDHPLLPQAAALLFTIVTHLLPDSTTLDEIEAMLYRLGHEAARQAAELRVQAQIAAYEQALPPCACGGRMRAEQKRTRTVLLLMGIISFPLRRYRCANCGTWRCPGAAGLRLEAQQRMTRGLWEIVTHFGVSWSYQVAATLLERVLPQAGVSAKTVERVTKASAHQREAYEDAQAQECLGARSAPEGNGAGEALGRPFLRPERIYVGLDGILVRGRAARAWLEIQVASLWSDWRELPNRKHPRREIVDRTLLARAAGWAGLGEQVWRVFVRRGGLQYDAGEVVVLGDGAHGIRSLWEWHFPTALRLLDAWHLWKKVKDRAREIFEHPARALGAAQGVYKRLRRGAVDEALEMIADWPAVTDWAQERRARLRAFLERNRDIIGDYVALREKGYMTGSGLTEKANDLVVAPRMKNGKMHWSRAGANAVALLRAFVLNHPEASILPS